MTLHFLIGYLGQFGFFAWVLLIGGIVLAFWKLKRGHTRTLTIVLILGLFAAYPGRWAWEVQKRVERYETGQAMFNERCETKAGYKIYKVVEDVDGILLPKVRHQVNDSDQMAPGAAFVKLDSHDDYYVGAFLYYRHLVEERYRHFVEERIDYQQAKPTEGRDIVPGFRYVDVIDEKDGQRYRVTGSMKATGKKNVKAEGVRRNIEKYPNYDLNVYNWVLDRIPAFEPAPRYAVTFEDHVIPEERQYGIASSTVKVIDTQTNEVLGEMTRYIRYPGTFERGNPSPWLRADQCPGTHSTDSTVHSVTRRFVDQILVARGATLPPPLKWSQLPN